MSEIEIIRRIISRRDIITKDEYYALYHQRMFGNRALAWDSYQELLKRGWKGGVCIMSRVGIHRDKVVYNIPLEKVREEIERLGSFEVPENLLVFNQSMPDHHLVLQGEVMEGKRKGLELTYTRVQKPMNLALKERTEFANALKARVLLKENLWPSSYSDLEALLELYPNCVVEFSAYDVAVGDIPGRNTVIWEVRNY